MKPGSHPAVKDTPDKAFLEAAEAFKQLQQNGSKHGTNNKKTISTGAVSSMCGSSIIDGNIGKGGE